MAMGRISRIDKRIKSDASVEAAVAFFERWSSVGSMTDDGHHGEGQHDE
ncbi:hypothetical protein I6F36_35195 [Bradyrhizobium sp. BRP19]|nr:hypothetical protein [Bradyrhizobium sp. IC3195]MCA1552045.1 hypothetical protein [Bradyrhizobium sp. BRP19]